MLMGRDSSAEFFLGLPLPFMLMGRDSSAEFFLGLPLPLPFTLMGRNSSVGIATRYGLDDPGIESRLDRDFPHPSRPALGLSQPPVNWIQGLSQGVKRLGRGVDDPPHLTPMFQEKVELYFYSPYGPSWPVLL